MSLDFDVRRRSGRTSYMHTMMGEMCRSSRGSDRLGGHARAESVLGTVGRTARVSTAAMDVLRLAGTHRRGTSFMWRMRPVPVVLLLLAFCPHSYDLILAAGNPHAAHSLCCLWKLRLLHRRQTVCVLVWRLPKEVVPFVTVGGAQRRNQVSRFPPTASLPCPVPRSCHPPARPWRRPPAPHLPSLPMARCTHS